MNGRCPVCGAAFNSEKCDYCGHVHSADALPAPQQNTYAPPQTVVVHQVVHQTAPAVSGYSRWAAFLLAFFLGGLGIHRFYVGKVGTGILWLLTGGMFGLGWLIDVILTACGSFKDKYGLVLRY